MTWRARSFIAGCAKCVRPRLASIKSDITQARGTKLNQPRERPVMLPKYTVEYTTQFRRHTQPNHYSTDDPVACEEFVGELLERGSGAARSAAHAPLSSAVYRGCRGTARNWRRVLRLLRASSLRFGQACGRAFWVGVTKQTSHQKKLWPTQPKNPPTSLAEPQGTRPQEPQNTTPISRSPATSAVNGR